MPPAGSRSGRNYGLPPTEAAVQNRSQGHRISSVAPASQYVELGRLQGTGRTPSPFLLSVRRRIQAVITARAAYRSYDALFLSKSH